MLHALHNIYGKPDYKFFLDIVTLLAKLQKQHIFSDTFFFSNVKAIDSWNTIR
jgi:hypothetical protein